MVTFRHGRESGLNAVGENHYGTDGGTYSFCLVRSDLLVTER